jgi:hypothetical protein
MIYYTFRIFKIILTIGIFISTTYIWSNMRAPWMINRYPSYTIISKNKSLIVLKEDLNFNCDSLYEGKGELKKILEKKCDVTAVYWINSENEETYSFEFVLPSRKIVSVDINEDLSEKISPKPFNISDLEREGYRLSNLCQFCESEVNHLFTIQFNSKIHVGTNRIQVKYEQPLSISESSYGYFTSSKWFNGFDYELWPLHEWNIDPKFELKIKFTTEVGNAWTRFINKSLDVGCIGLDLAFDKYPGVPFQKEMGSNGVETYYKFSSDRSIKYNNISKIHYEKNNLVYELVLDRKFPDRLNCYFGKE